MKVLVCGGRDYGDRRFLFLMLDRVHARSPITTIIEGGAAGADRFAREWALARGVDVVTFPADWERHGMRAGPVRNARMLREGCPNLVVAFQGGRGTTDMILKAGRAGVSVLRTWKYKDSGLQSPVSGLAV